MAATTLLIQFTWENNVNFKMESKKNAEATVTILALQENACLPKLWEAGIQETIMTYLEYEVTKIGTEMKAPPP